MPRRRLLVVLGIAALGSAAQAGSGPFPPVSVPPATVIGLDDASRATKEALDRRYKALSTRFQAWKKRAEDFNTKYVGREFAEDSQEAKDGAAENAWLARERKEYTDAAAQFASDVERFGVDGARYIACMNAKARDLGWDADELARLDKALNRLATIADSKVTDGMIADTWRAVEARGQDAALEREAGKGEGPGLPGAGNQTLEDCAIFALANASGQPYGVVGARAVRLIEEGPWRADADREHPRQVIEREGLRGGEVVMLAEAFGRAEVVEVADFARTLKEGRPVLACVTVLDAHGLRFGHEVVLTRTFQHDHETWYEMQDSNQGPLQRRYLSDRELKIMLRENGVAYRRDPGTTPKPLRMKAPR